MSNSFTILSEPVLGCIDLKFSEKYVIHLSSIFRELQTYLVAFLEIPDPRVGFRITLQHSGLRALVRDCFSPRSSA